MSHHIFNTASGNFYKSFVQSNQAALIRTGPPAGFHTSDRQFRRGHSVFLKPWIELGKNFRKDPPTLLFHKTGHYASLLLQYRWGLLPGATKTPHQK